MNKITIIDVRTEVETWVYVETTIETYRRAPDAKWWTCYSSSYDTTKEENDKINMAYEKYMLAEKIDEWNHNPEQR